MTITPEQAVVELADVARRLGAPWTVTDNLEDGYGMRDARVIGVRNSETDEAVKLWVNGNDIRISAHNFLDDEISDELHLSKAEHYGEVVYALAAKNWLRDGWRISVKIPSARRSIRLALWQA